MPALCAHAGVGRARPPSGLMCVLCDITKDGDFRDSHFLHGTPARLLRITLGNLANAELTALVEAHWAIIAELAEQARCYMELSHAGIVRFPRDSPTW